LEQRACLLILDDVWQRKHAEVFRVGGPHCRLLITTRDSEIARELGASVRPVPAMTVDEAIALLEEWAGDALAGTEQSVKEQVVKRVGCLPLAVKLAGAQLQRKAPDEWLRTFDARKLKSKRPEGVHDSLEQTFGLSLDALAIFKEDEAVRETGIARLWEALGAIAAHIIEIGGEWKWSRIQVVLKD